MKTGILPECKLCRVLWPEAAAQSPNPSPSPELDQLQNRHWIEHLQRDDLLEHDTLHLYGATA